MLHSPGDPIRNIKIRGGIWCREDGNGKLLEEAKVRGNEKIKDKQEAIQSCQGPKGLFFPVSENHDLGLGAR